MDSAELWREQLEAHLPAGVESRPAAIDRLLAYLALLDKWNRAFNLTGVKQRDQWVPRHILDSLTLLPWIERGPLLDVGSGAGLPGVPLAIVLTQVPCTLLDSNGKKTRFLQQVRADLDLDNLYVRRARAEELHGDLYPIVTCRAFAPLPEFVAATRQSLAPDGCWLAMKSERIDDEIAALPDDISVQCHRVRVPLLETTRQIVRMSSRGHASQL